MSFIDGRRKHTKKLCTDMKGEAAENFMNTYSCIKNNSRTRQRFIDSEIEAIKSIYAILSDQVREFKERFQRACCVITHYRAKSIEDMSPECSQGPNVAVVDGLIESIVGEALEFACPDTKSSICNAMKPLKLAKEKPTKSLSRAGTDLIIILTADEDETTESTANANFTTTQATRAPKKLRKP